MAIAEVDDTEIRKGDDLLENTISLQRKKDDHKRVKYLDI
jgi:hypothetical protein